MSTRRHVASSSSEVGHITNVITSIAEQTNRLALNATIEAARAGETGKGFAVVANEVKELAKGTARATEDISDKVNAIQADSTNAVEAIGKTSVIMEEINHIQETIDSACRAGRTDESRIIYFTATRRSRARSSFRVHPSRPSRAGAAAAGSAHPARPRGTPRSRDERRVR